MNILRTSDIRPDPVSRRNVQKFIKIKKFGIFTAKKSGFRISVTLEMINEYKFGFKIFFRNPETTNIPSESVYLNKKSYINKQKQKLEIFKYKKAILCNSIVLECEI